MNESIISVRGLTKTYHVGDIDVHALRGVDMEVAAGEFVCVVGHSGSGKSTLFNILGGLTPPSTGEVFLHGKNLRAMTEADRTNLRKTDIGFVFQKYNLLPTLSGKDNIAIACAIAGRPFDENDAHFKDTLNTLGIAHRLNHKPRAMSGGEQQRVAIARALVNHPSILLADEPTGNLDTANSEAVLKLLRDLNKRLNQTILMITHNPDAAGFGDRIVHMKDGKVDG